MKEILADVSHSAFTAEQIAVLRRVLTKVVNRLDGDLHLRGKRVQTELVIGTTFEVTIDCPFIPKTVLVLSAKQPTISYMTPSLSWVANSTPTGASVTITDPLGLIPAIGTDPTLLDVFMEKSDG